MSSRGWSDDTMTVPQTCDRWRKSSFSANTENCVEVAIGPTVG
ncbi:MAG: DUF397 domain-containing protein, partial [Pseudonocardiaceae bacterium]|nr:DUF397 domain-containing protein [Pseudonocardiaceae bacterium]